MKQLILKPNGWPVTLSECPPGLFLTEEEFICFKNDYGEYFNRCGEYLAHPFNSPNSIVQPLESSWENI